MVRFVGGTGRAGKQGFWWNLWGAVVEQLCRAFGDIGMHFLWVHDPMQSGPGVLWYWRSTLCSNNETPQQMCVCVYCGCPSALFPALAVTSSLFMHHIISAHD